MRSHTGAFLFLAERLVKKRTKPSARVYNRGAVQSKASMMRFPVVLAHGALGPYDELILLGAAVIFLVFMGISWVKSRNTRPDFEQPNEAESPREHGQTANEPDHFSLD